MSPVITGSTKPEWLSRSLWPGESYVQTGAPCVPSGSRASATYGSPFLYWEAAKFERSRK